MEPPKRKPRAVLRMKSLLPTRAPPSGTTSTRAEATCPPCRECNVACDAIGAHQMWHLHPPQCAEFAVSPEGGMRALNTPTQALPQVVRSSNSGKPAAWCEHVSRQVAAVVFQVESLFGCCHMPRTANHSDAKWPPTYQCEGPLLSSDSRYFQMTANSIDWMAFASSRVPKPRQSNPRHPSAATTWFMAST